MRLISRIRNWIGRQPDTDPETAYDLWAAQYDQQPDNLILALDEELFSILISNISIENKIIADIGCGTGRHWKKIMDKHPRQLIGYDVSQGMLNKLHEKFPGAVTRLLTDNRLAGLTDQSCDLIISTLAVAHIDRIENAFAEWCRVLKPGGEILITDYHPEALLRGGNRTFKHHGKLIAVSNHIYPLSQINQLFRQLQCTTLRFIERKIDDPVKVYYEKQQALHIFERFKGTPVIYGLHLKKTHAAP